MTREAFIAELKGKSYSYEIEGDKIIITNGDPGRRGLGEDRIILEHFKTIPSGVIFNNEGLVDLDSLTSIPNDVEFHCLDVNLEFIIGGWLEDWSGNIKGIDRNSLLNLLISKGVFER